VPRAKVDPDGGTQLGVPTPGQLSETEGLRVTAAPAGPVHSTTGEGHVMPGFSRSLTVILAVHELVC
jgi:hypothetical protein